MRLLQLSSRCAMKLWYALRRAAWKATYGRSVSWLGSTMLPKHVSSCYATKLLLVRPAFCNIAGSQTLGRYPAVRKPE